MSVQDSESLIFVGRKAEIMYTLSLLEAENPIWILHFRGDGGIGKTKLLEALGSEFAKRGCFVPDLVDLYDFANQSKDSLLSTLSHRLGVEHFPLFSKRQGQEPEHLEDAYQYELDLVEDFITDYTNWASGQSSILLRFDTLENIQGRNFAEWLLRNFLPRLHTNTVILTAGREPIPNEYLDEHFVQHELAGLKLGEAVDYARRHFMKQEVPYDVDDKTFEMIYDLAEGRPILIALAVDWMLYNADPESLASIPKDEFEREMVTWVRELPAVENKAILHMAIIHKRFDAELLAWLVDVTLEQAQAALSHLQHFAFIKHRVDLGEYALHDEMRYLVGKHAGYPPAIRREIAGKVAQFYKDYKIPKVQEPLENRTLRIEYLQYLLNSNVNIDKAFQEAIDLFGTYIRQGAIDFSRLILEVMETQLAKFKPDQFNRFEVSRARLHKHRHEYTQSRSILEMLNRQPGLTAPVQIELYSILASIEQETDSLRQALSYYEQSLSLIEAQIKEGRGEFRDLSQTQRNIASVKRLLGEYEDAREWNELSLAVEEQRHDRAGIAACLNNIANLDRLQGDYIRARNNAREALEWRRRLRIPDTARSRLIGFSLSTLGMIERDAGNIDDAVVLFTQARDAYEAANDEVHYAKSLANLGSIYYWREIRRSEVVLLEVESEEDALSPVLRENVIHLEPEHYLREDWQKYFGGFRWERGELHRRWMESSDYLERSQRVFKRLNRLSDLAETLNHKGRLLIHRSDWFEAEDAFKASLDLGSHVEAEPLVVDNLVSLVLVNYLKQTADEIADLLEEITRLKEVEEQLYGGPLSRLELTLGNIAFERAQWDPATASYQRAFEHYVEACARALAFSWSSFESAKYVLRDRLQRTHPEFISPVCDFLTEFWRSDTRGLHKRDTSFLDVVRNVRLRRLLDADGE